MARDYGSKRLVSRKKSAPHQFLVATLTFLLGYLTASVVDIQTVSHWMSTQVLAHNEHQPAPAKHNSQKSAAIPPKPKFEFYTLLANEKVPASQVHTHPAQPKVSEVAAKPVPATQQLSASAVTSVKAAANPVVVSKPAQVKVAEGKPVSATAHVQYVLQVAAFKTQQDAEHMKAMLILKGYNVSVAPVTNARGNWFRVIIGPYADKSLAQRAQANIAKTERLKGMINPVAG